ncbi:MAG: T9SS type A sorting domain-containing protein [Chitinophagaceae bacterium]|nr:T9SS type A sorting domain-containing protein [Chitinophagaceae bacterium]
MKTNFTSKKTLITIVASVVTACMFAQSGSSNLSAGLNFQNPQLIAGTDLQVGAQYRFASVNDTTDAVVTIDSLINGAKVNKIDDNSNGTGYKTAFQPAVQTGSGAGISYAVFKVSFYKKNTAILSALQVVNATALDIDGNNQLKEYARINIGNGGSMSYMSATTDISVGTINSGHFLGQNQAGVEKTGIDTAAYSNMYTATNSAISSFSVAYGATTTNPTNSVRQYSLYLKSFNYPPAATLPVQLLSFTAVLSEDTKANLAWTTASEVNFSHFVIERSSDGVNFNDVAIVLANGNTNDNSSYSFVDNLSYPRNMLVFYRLRMLDIDGKAKYSDVRVIRIATQTVNTISITAFPNPAINNLRVTIPSAWQNKKVQYELFGLNGILIMKLDRANSTQTETFDVRSISPGVYILRATCNSEVSTQRIVKQ